MIINTFHGIICKSDRHMIINTFHGIICKSDRHMIINNGIRCKSDTDT